MSSFPAFLRLRIKSIREKQEGWGPTTILAELKADSRLASQELPSRSTIGEFLRQEQLSRRNEPHSSLPVEACPKTARCHELWQVDGQGNSSVTGVGPVAMLNVKYVHSTTYVSSFPARMKSKRGHPNTSDYQTALRLGFMHHGRPERLQTDHASVFYENKSKSPFPTLFCLWLVSLGIKPCFSRVNQPTDQGRVERAHQTVFAQVLRRRTSYQNWEHLFEWCEKRRTRLNEVIPSRATDDLPPLVKYPEAKHSGRFYHPTTEAQLICLEKVWAFLAKGKWFRKVASSRTICLGGQVYYVPGTVAGQQLQITLCKQEKCLMFHNDKELLIAKIPLKGITRETLMGNLEPLVQFPNFQLELPLYWEAQKTNTTFSDST